MIKVALKLFCKDVGLLQGKYNKLYTVKNNTINCSDNAADVVFYEFITMGCPNDFDTLEIISNGESDVVNFILESFQFKGLEDASIFLHCNVSLLVKNAKISNTKP